MKDCPCKYCDERTPTCHSTCDKGYKEFAEQCERERSRRRSIKQSEYYSKNAEKFFEKKRRKR